VITSRLISISATIAVLLTSFTFGADTLTFSCEGELVLLAGGRQVNPAHERSIMVTKVNLPTREITVDTVIFPIPEFADMNHDTIVAMDPDKGSVTFNRISGSLSVHFITPEGLKTFYGKCHPAKPLF